MVTVGEEIEQWKERYEKEDELGKKAMGAIAALEYFKWEHIWKFVKEQNPKWQER